MSAFNLQDCDGWSRVSSDGNYSYVTIIENYEAELAKSAFLGKSIVDSGKFYIEDATLSTRILTMKPTSFFGEKEAYAKLVNHGEKEIKVKIRFLALGLSTSYTIETVKPGMTSRSHHIDLQNRVPGNLVNGGELQVKVEIIMLKIKSEDRKIVSGGKLSVAGPKLSDEMKMKEFPASNLLEKCFLNASYDFKLTSNGVEFPCHKLVIAGQSETLKGAIERWLPEGVMKVDEHKPDVIKNLVKYCYRRPIDGKVFEDNLIEFLEVGEKFDLPQLKLKAELSMVSILNKENFIDMMIAGDLYGAEKVKMAALKFLTQNKEMWKEKEIEWKEMLKDKNDLLLEIIDVLIA